MRARLLAWKPSVWDRAKRWPLLALAIFALLGCCGASCAGIDSRAGDPASGSAPLDSAIAYAYAAGASGLPGGGQAIAIGDRCAPVGESPAGSFDPVAAASGAAMDRTPASNQGGTDRAPIIKWLVRGFAMFGLIALCWWIYGLIVPEAVEITPNSLSVDPASIDPVVTLAANLDVPLLDGNSVELLINGDEIFPAMLAAIREARTSVSFLTYIYWEGDIAQQFAAELTAAAERGVEVRVLVDAFGGLRMNTDLIDRMRAAGCRFTWFHPVRWYNLRRFNNRTHRKVLVVDGRVGFTGGVGIGAEWTGHAQDADHWRDNHFRIEGPILRYLLGAFAENWRQASGETLAGERMFPTLPAAGAVRMVSLNAAPKGTISDVAFAYWLLFHCAQTEVRIATPYFVPDPDMKLGIANAARRGVRISLLVPGPIQDSALARCSSRTYYRRLLEAGVRIFEFQPTMMHAKMVSIDDTWAVIGSANFDSRSFELNYEIALAVQDPGLIQALGESWAADISRSKEVTLADVDNWSWFARLRDRAALLLREQL